MTNIEQLTRRNRMVSTSIDENFARNIRAIDRKLRFGSGPLIFPGILEFPSSRATDAFFDKAVEALVFFRPLLRP